MIGGSTSKRKSLNPAWLRCDLRPLANVHCLGLVVDCYCDVFTFTREGHGSDKPRRKQAMRMDEGWLLSHPPQMIFELTQGIFDLA